MASTSNVVMSPRTTRTRVTAVRQLLDRPPWGELHIVGRGMSLLVAFDVEVLPQVQLIAPRIQEGRAAAPELGPEVVLPQDRRTAFASCFDDALERVVLADEDPHRRSRLDGYAT